MDSVFGIITGGKEGKAQAQLEENQRLIKELVTPDYRRMQLTPEEMQLAGIYTPEMEEALRLRDSRLGDIQEDPRLREAQLGALQKLMNISNSGGMDAIDKSKLAQVQSQINQQEHGNREALKQNMQQRGMAGSGFELASQLANQQASADRASNEGLNIAAQAQARALEALMNSQSVASGMRNQDFSIQSQKAQSQDAIDKFNTMNSQDVMSRNTQSRNQAQATNMQNKQDVMNQNVNLRNQAQANNKNLIQQNYENELRKLGLVTDSNKNMASMYQDQANQRRQLVGDVVGAGASAYGRSK